MSKNRILLFFSVLLISMLACSVFVGGPDFPEQHIPVSPEAVQSLQEQIKQAVEAGAQSGVVSLQITEEQLTSYIALKLATQNEPAITDPQVYLRNGQMQVFGKVDRGLWNANVMVALDVTVDEQGQPKIDIAAADFGPIPAPEALKQSVAGLITEAYTGSLGPVATGFRLESINIANGVMMVTGRIK